MQHLYRILIMLLFVPQMLAAQVLDAIDIHLTISEKSGQEVSALPNATLRIEEVGEVKTDIKGNFDFTYPVRNDVDPEIKIALVSDEHKMLKPVDGSIALDPSREEMYIEFLVVNMESESPAFKKRIESLEKRIKGLKSKNNLTTRQLNALNNTLLDTILFYEANRQMLENQIAEFEQLSDEQQEEISDLRSKITGLESQVDQLTLDLEEALEEKYLRQNETYKNITGSLLAYLRKAKDIRDHLPFISTYFSSPSGYENYGKDIQAYNSLWEEFDNGRMSYIEGVTHHWENKALANRVEDVFNFLVKSIHQNQMLPVVRDINNELHRQKPKKAQKIASQSHSDMSTNIGALEKQINRVMLLLRKNI